MPKFESSKAQRNSLRVQSGAEIAGNAVAILSPAAKIPCKVAQSVASFYSFFSKETTPFEKGIGLTQGLISVAQVALLGYVYAQKLKCPDESVCTALMLCDLVYEGILLSNLFVSEINKKPHGDSPPATPLLEPVAAMPRREEQKDNAPEREPESRSTFVMWDC